VLGCNVSVKVIAMLSGQYWRMDVGMVEMLACRPRGSPAAWVEVAAAGHLPAEWGRWSAEKQESFGRLRDSLRRLGFRSTE